jgi:hypothetical protein
MEEKKKYEISIEVWDILEKYNALMERGVTCKTLAIETGVSYHYFYKMVVERSVPPFKTESMLEKAKDFLRRNDVRELLAISKSKLIK